MKSLIFSGAAAITLAALLTGSAAGFPNENGHSNGGSGGNSHPNNSGGSNSNKSNGNGQSNNSGKNNSNSGQSNNSGKNNSNSGQSNNSGKSNSNSGQSSSSGKNNSNSGQSNSGQANSGGKSNSSSGISHSSSGTSKTPAKSNPPPKIVHNDKSGKIHDDKGRPTNSTSSSHNALHSKVDKKHFHDDVNFHYKHKFGQEWDKAEWHHCWYRWYCFHNDHQYWNGNLCWYDPDVSQWVAYNAGDSIPEDYLVADKALPTVVDSASIRLMNPNDTQATLSYTVNDFAYEMQAGDHQDLPTDRTWVVRFNRGGDFGDAEYTLEAGEYDFAPSDHGWELIQASANDDSENAAAPESSLPRIRSPSNLGRDGISVRSSV